MQAHTGILRQERNIARLLMEQLRQARQYAPPDEAWHYDQMIRKVEKLERYFASMADQVDHMSIELARLSVEINLTLRDAGNTLKAL